MKNTYLRGGIFGPHPLGRILPAVTAVFVLAALLVFTGCSSGGSGGGGNPGATVDNVVIAGLTGDPITKDITIRLTNTSFIAINDGEDVASYFASFPSGFTATVNGAVIAGDREMTVTITKTGPITATKAALSITIPAAALSTAANLAITANPNAKFNIADALAATVADVVIGGVQNNPITEQYILIDLDGTVFESIAVGTDVSSKITNLPGDLTMAVKEDPAGRDQLRIAVTGTPTGTVNNDTITWTGDIEAGWNASGTAIPITANPNAKFNITLVPTATVGNVEIKGAVGSPLAGTDVTITLSNTGFAAFAANADVSGWFTNKPAGLSAKVKNAVSSGDAAITVTISGTPTVVSSAALVITLPPSSNNSSWQTPVTSNANAKFTIVPQPTAAGPTIDRVLYSSGNNVVQDQVVTITLPTGVSITGSHYQATPFPGVAVVPAGLIPQVAADVSGGQILKLRFDGKPTERSTAVLDITIPAAWTTLGIDLKVKTNNNVKFNIKGWKIELTGFDSYDGNYAAIGLYTQTQLDQLQHEIQHGGNPEAIVVNYAAGSMLDPITSGTTFDIWYNQSDNVWYPGNGTTYTPLLILAASEEDLETLEDLTLFLGNTSQNFNTDRSLAIGAFTQLYP
jgi:hypothetical protein